MGAYSNTDNERVFENFMKHILELSPDFIGLGFGQSRVLFESETPVQFPNIIYIGLMDTTYGFKTPVNPFPSLRTLDLHGGTLYLGFPPNKIKQLSIDASKNLRS